MTNIEEGMGVYMTLAEMRAYVESPPSVEAERTINGRTPIKRMQALADKCEKALHKQMVGRVTQLHERATGRVEQADATLDLVEEKLTEWSKGLRSGRLSPDEVLANVREVPQVLTAVSSDLDASRDDAIASGEFMQQSPEEFQQAELARFTHLKGVAVTEAFLRGETEDYPRLPGSDS